MPKRILIVAIIIAIVCYPSLFFLPWWVNLIIAFAITYPAKLRPMQGFVAGGIGVSICWAAIAIWADIGNAHVLSTRMAGLFHLPKYWMIIAITILAGFISGALGGLTASLLRTKPKPTETIK